jgi:hypothetical protein
MDTSRDHRCDVSTDLVVRNTYFFQCVVCFKRFGDCQSAYVFEASSAST